MFHDLEVEKIWKRCWQMACHEDDIPEVGDYLVYEFLGDLSSQFPNVPYERRHKTAHVTWQQHGTARAKTSCAGWTELAAGNGGSGSRVLSGRSGRSGGSGQ